MHKRNRDPESQIQHWKLNHENNRVTVVIKFYNLKSELRKLIYIKKQSIHTDLCKFWLPIKAATLISIASSKLVISVIDMDISENTRKEFSF